jgi:O-antigen ligase
VYSNGLVLDRESETSTGVRLLVWDASLNLIESNFVLGVGSDNAYERLKKVYKQKRYVQPFRKRLNAHNQFFQIIIECGVFGLLILLVPIGILLSGFKKQGIVNAFVLIIVVNFLFEVVLNRYSGIMGYTFFCCLFIVLKPKLKINVLDKFD